MSETFSLKILAADKTFYDGEAISLVIPAEDGELEIMAHHENMVVANCSGVIRLRTPGEDIRAVVGIGFVNIRSNTVTMLVDSAERPEDIDMVRAREAYERAQEQLRQDQSIQEYRLSQASLARAMVRLAEGGKRPIE